MRIQNPEYDPWATVITMGTIKDDFSEYQVKYIRKLLNMILRFTNQINFLVGHITRLSPKSLHGSNLTLPNLTLIIIDLSYRV